MVGGFSRFSTERRVACAPSQRHPMPECPAQVHGGPDLQQFWASWTPVPLPPSPPPNRASPWVFLAPCSLPLSTLQAIVFEALEAIELSLSTPFIPPPLSLCTRTSLQSRFCIPYLRPRGSSFPSSSSPLLPSYLLYVRAIANPPLVPVHPPHTEYSCRYRMQYDDVTSHSSH